MDRLRWITSAIRWLLIALRFIVPQILRVVMVMVRLVLAAVLTFWTGVPEAVRRIVRTWMEEAWSANTPTEYDTILRWVFTIVAYAMIVGGWVGFSYLTVYIVAWLI